MSFELALRLRLSCMLLGLLFGGDCKASSSSIIGFGAGSDCRKGSFSVRGAVDRLGPGCDGIDSGLLEVGGACGTRFGTFLSGKGTSSDSPPLSAVSQQFRKPRHPRDFFDFGFGTDCVVVRLTLAAFPCMTPGEVPDFLLLATLPLRRGPIMLPFDSFDCLLMLSVGSVTVAPLRPVDVGEGCIFCEDEREGTRSKPRFFLDPSGDSVVEYDASSSVGNSG